MQKIDRLPALPLIACDPYFSIWSAGDKLTDTDTSHWTGEKKRLRGRLLIDGKSYRFLGRGPGAAMETVSLKVTPLKTACVMQAEGIRLTITFTTPLLLHDPALFSTPIVFIDISLESTDQASHITKLSFIANDELCYSGDKRPNMIRDEFMTAGLSVAYTGQRRQNLLCHSGDHITIDWGYLYLASKETVATSNEGLEIQSEYQVEAGVSQHIHFLLGYDDMASINYFGMPTKAWYARNGKTIVEALLEFSENRESILRSCDAFDDELMKEAGARGGEDYQLICSAAYRQSICAHKLIADENGQMVLLSKENDSNGCIGTVDVSYPSIPLFLKYNPDLVPALCRHILRFSQMQVWTYDFPPHDVGRYPHATGQVYGVKKREILGGEIRNGDIHPPYYLYPSDTDCYDLQYQMPIEECGNMLIMLYAAAHCGSRFKLTEAELSLLKKWADYLIKHGEDPGNQLCTDDFAGHLARNVNLAAKAFIGVACFGKLLEGIMHENAAHYLAEAKRMAKSWKERAVSDGYSSLTFDGYGWSMKYNLVWDKALKLGLLDDDFYQQEINSYQSHINNYGLPLDSRRSYTKSDWILWTASIAEDQEMFKQLIAPVAKYLRETKSRVPFGDWYDTQTGDHIAFKARSVQGGAMMPLLL